MKTTSTARTERALPKCATGIEGLDAITSAEAQTSGKLAWGAEVVLRQVNQLGRLVDDLLDASRITTGKIRIEPTRADLGDVVKRGIETARPFVDDKRHELSVELPREPLWAEVDVARLSQVVTNLVHNAAKFTPEGGRVRVTLEQRGEHARLCVADNGIGIAPAALERVFGMFAQVDTTRERSDGGLGIGLSLARSLVEMHSGTIQASSGGAGRGSEFVVTLPLCAAPTTGERPTPEPLVHTTSPLRVLVVDDDPDVAESTMLVISAMGHDARMITSPARVIHEARAFLPHVILLDIGMPGVNGYELARELKRTDGLDGVVLLAQTGFSRDEDLARSREAGIDHHWVKPIDVDALNRLLSGIAHRVC